MLFRIIFISWFLLLMTSCTGQEPRKPIQYKSGSFIKESAERNKKIYDEEKEFIKEIMRKDSTETYYSSEQGFWYSYKVRDTSQSNSPQVGDVVRFSYDIRDFSNHTILSKEDVGIQEYKVDQSNQDLISGIREGIKLMKPGEEVNFLFPSYKAYGYYGLEDKIGTNLPVQSTVKLYSIESSQTFNKEE